MGKRGPKRGLTHELEMAFGRLVLDGYSLPAAARALCVARRTAYRWLHEDEEFRGLLAIAAWATVRFARSAAGVDVPSSEEVKEARDILAAFYEKNPYKRAELLNACFACLQANKALDHEFTGPPTELRLALGGLRMMTVLKERRGEA